MIALAQVNPTVGDLAGNTRLVLEWIDKAKVAGADIVCFPELVLTGYPPEDLVLKPSFVRDNIAQLTSIAHATKGISAVVGFVDEEGDIFNAAAFLSGGEIKAVFHKVFLPNYGVFDEKRYFEPGHRCPIVEVDGVRIGLSVCEDCWFPSGPMAWEAHHGAEVLININGSPYHYGKRAPREAMIAGRAADYGAFLAWVNTVGGQDELVFDGNSVVFDPHGRLLAHAASFVEELLVCDVDTSQPMHRPVEKLRRESEAAERLELDVTEVQVDGSTGGKAKPHIEQRLAVPLEGAAEIYAAVVLGTHDYMRKQGFEKVVIGMSGGVDSALTAAIACDALGAQNVIGVRMPSRHTSTESLDDAGLVAESLGMQLMDFSIEPPHKGFEEILAPVFRGTKPGVAEENLQPRIRSTILHALSNKFGYIEDDLSAEELVAAGHQPETVARVIQLVDRSEYKRRQAPPGVKITERAFGRDRRMPIVNRYSPNGVRPAEKRDR